MLGVPRRLLSCVFGSNRGDGEPTSVLAGLVKLSGICVLGVATAVGMMLTGLLDLCLWPFKCLVDGVRRRIDIADTNHLIDGAGSLSAAQDSDLERAIALSLLDQRDPPSYAEAVRGGGVALQQEDLLGRSPGVFSPAPSAPYESCGNPPVYVWGL